MSTAAGCGVSFLRHSEETLTETLPCHLQKWFSGHPTRGVGAQLESSPRGVPYIFWHVRDLLYPNRQLENLSAEGHQFQIYVARQTRHHCGVFPASLQLLE